MIAIQFWLTHSQNLVVAFLGQKLSYFLSTEFFIEILKRILSWTITPTITSMSIVVYVLAKRIQIIFDYGNRQLTIIEVPPPVLIEPLN